MQVDLIVSVARIRQAKDLVLCIWHKMNQEYKLLKSIPKIKNLALFIK